MKENGIVVYLKIPYEEVEKRLGDLKKRGVVLKEGFTLKDLYNERAPLYERHADYIVDLDEDTVENSAEKIRKIVITGGNTSGVLGITNLIKIEDI